jgi:hypothetical protein
MKNKSSFFDLKTSNEHDENVLKKASLALNEKRIQERRKLWSWILIPTTAIAGLILALRVGNNWGVETAREDIILFADLENEVDLEILADLEILEEIDDLEAWDESSDT